jgi:hypothetical protein
LGGKIEFGRADDIVMGFSIFAGWGELFRIVIL